MSTLDELVHYCRSEDPIGAFMLNGEWGSGKTYLIEERLTDALKDTHLIVRISLYGMNNVEVMRKEVKGKWIAACSPALGRLVKEKEQVTKNGGLVAALGSILSGLNPAAGRAASVMVNLDLTEFVKIEPVIEDVHTLQKKNIVLVFDDLERSKLDPVEAMGLINEFCENMHFHCIIVTNESYLIHTLADNLMYHMLKAKTVSRTIFFVPDFESIIANIIKIRPWSSPEYKQFLEDHKSGILKLFASEQAEPEISSHGIVKTHNLLALINGMEEFYRIYFHLNKTGVEAMEPWFYSFLAYHLVRKSGFLKNGVLHNDCSDEELQELYPEYQPPYLFNSMRKWISYGIWDREAFKQELADFLNN